MSMSEEARFRDVFRRAHAHHARCSSDEWLMQPCMLPDGSPAPRPVVWSRRNGPWRRVDLLWVGAAPGNAGGMGSGHLGAHGTRIPFGGDIAGGNLDVLMGAVGLSRNDTFIVAALNQLPEKGGGEPSVREIAAPVGDHHDSVTLLRDTIIAAGPRLIIALGNVALRVTVAAITRDHDAPLRLPGPRTLEAAGFRRGTVIPWPAAALPPAPATLARWKDAWTGDEMPHVVQVLHPSAQNMSPFAGQTTVFHRRMLETRDAVRSAVASVLGRDLPATRPPSPDDGVYALPEWRELIRPAHARFDELWRAHGV